MSRRIWTRRGRRRRRETVGRKRVRVSVDNMKSKLRRAGISTRCVTRADRWRGVNAPLARPCGNGSRRAMDRVRRLALLGLFAVSAFSWRLVPATPQVDSLREARDLAVRMLEEGQGPEGYW